jgi:environmental stress-induced protein Ves
MLQRIRQSEFVEGRWKNGMGVSWEIAALREEGAADFSWRLAMARIDTDVPFSIYPGMDRVFMQLKGNGLDLEFEGGHVLHVHQSFVPHSFSCDIPLDCKLLDGPCMDLNLFTKRGRYRSEASVVSIAGQRQLQVVNPATLLFVLKGACRVSAGDTSVELSEGDAAVARDVMSANIQSDAAKVFIGQIIRV